MSITSVRFQERPVKPRRSALNMISDHGPVDTGWMGRQGLKDYLEVVGPFLDYAKIRADLHHLNSRDWITERLADYADADVFAYPGGILFELAFLQGTTDALFDELAEWGYRGLEISENYISLSSAERARYMRRASAAGLEVIYELGRKEEHEDPVALRWVLDTVDEVFQHGTRLAVLERDEVEPLRRAAPQVLNEIQDAVGDRIAFEAGPNRFPDLPVWLIQQLGLEASLANLQAGQLLHVERYRLGLDRYVHYRFVTELMERRDTSTADPAAV